MNWQNVLKWIYICFLFQESCEYPEMFLRSIYYFTPACSVLLTAAIVLFLLLIVEKNKNKIRSNSTQAKNEVVSEEKIYDEIVQIPALREELTVENDMYGTIP